MKISVITPSGQMVVEGNKGVNLTPHFKLEELANNAGDPAKPQYLYGPQQQIFLMTLEQFRMWAGLPVVVNSGYRQPEYNKKIGGDANSPHLRALAADIKPVKGLSREEHARLWLRCCYDQGIIGAINMYPESSGYYHMEAFSDVVYGYRQSRVRVYSAADLAAYKNIFQWAPVDVVRS